MISVNFDVNDDIIRSNFLKVILPLALSKLDESNNANWGKMSAQHMIEHLLWSVEFSTGKQESEWLSQELPQERLKLFLYTNRPMTRNFINPIIGENLPSLKFANIIDAKKAFIEECKLYYDMLSEDPEKIMVHPVFGPLSLEAWERVHFKHCYHHFLQFGLIEQENKD